MKPIEMGLLVGLLISTVSPAVASHDPTCNGTHIKFSNNIHSSGSYFVHAHVRFDAAGDATGEGVLAIHRRPRAVLVVDAGATEAECALGDGSLLQVRLLFSNPRTGEGADVFAVPSGEVDRGGWRPAEFILVRDGRVSEQATGRIKQTPRLRDR
jgi:hypothetical protein